MYLYWTTVLLRAFLGLVKGLDGRHIEHVLNAERQFVSLGENSPEQVYGCVRDRQRQ